MLAHACSGAGERHSAPTAAHGRHKQQGTEGPLAPILSCLVVKPCNTMLPCIRINMTLQSMHLILSLPLDSIAHTVWL